SDVCSSDLADRGAPARRLERHQRRRRNQAREGARPREDDRHGAVRLGVTLSVEALQSRVPRIEGAAAAALALKPFSPRSRTIGRLSRTMDRIERLAPAAAALTLLLLVAGCAGSPAADIPAAGTRPRIVDPAPAARAAPSRDDADVRATITGIATDMIGVPYRYGGTSPAEGFDCSGLVFYSYSGAGLSVPRNSVELFKAARKIPLDAAREGDLVFFQDQRKLSHVGIYLGE